MSSSSCSSCMVHSVCVPKYITRRQPVQVRAPRARYTQCVYRSTSLDVNPFKFVLLVHGTLSVCTEVHHSTSTRSSSCSSCMVHSVCVPKYITRRQPVQVRAPRAWYTQCVYRSTSLDVNPFKFVLLVHGTLSVCTEVHHSTSTSSCSSCTVHSVCVPKYITRRQPVQVRAPRARYTQCVYRSTSLDVNPFKFVLLVHGTLSVCTEVHHSTSTRSSSCSSCTVHSVCVPKYITRRQPVQVRAPRAWYTQCVYRSTSLDVNPFKFVLLVHGTLSVCTEVHHSTSTRSSSCSSCTVHSVCVPKYITRRQPVQVRAPRARYTQCVYRSTSLDVNPFKFVLLVHGTLSVCTEVHHSTSTRSSSCSSCMVHSVCVPKYITNCITRRQPVRSLRSSDPSLPRAPSQSG